MLGIMRRTICRISSVGIGLIIAGCGAAPPPASPASPSPRVDASNQIIGTRAEGTAKELLARGENALLAQRWQEAVDAFEALLAGDPAAAQNPQIIYDLALAYEGLGEREKARTRYRD